MATGAGAQASGNSFVSSLSADGQLVGFYSAAANLVAGDTNLANDIFVRDRATGVTERVSVATDGTQGNGASFEALVSADGQTVAFRSAASNLVSGDTNATIDVFVHDRLAHTTQRVSVATGGGQSNNQSIEPGISADGQLVVFRSTASNLVSGDTNGANDIFVHDRGAGVTERVSVASDGTQANLTCQSPTITADGRFVVFMSFGASTLVPGVFGTQVYVHDRTFNQTDVVSTAANGTPGNGSSLQPAVSPDGRYVAFQSLASNLVSGDTNNQPDIYVAPNPLW